MGVRIGKAKGNVSIDLIFISYHRLPGKQLKPEAA